MLPSFKYLSNKLFSSSSTSQVGSILHHPVQGNLSLPQTATQYSSERRAKPLVGDLIPGSYHTTTDTPVVVEGYVPASPSSGPFAGAHDFQIYKAKMVDQSHSYFMHGRTVFDVLEPASAPEAALDAGARYPPPLCHPGSRKTIKQRLEERLLERNADRRMTWLYGPAGVGKSAVAQTFGEQATLHNRLGAAFFFAALDDKRSNPLRIVPTLAYQLAIHDPYYKHLITHQLASDPSILHATLRVQFQKLIVRPFSLRPQTPNTKPHIIILDGLDECRDEDAQCELIEMINGAVQRHDIPLIWLVCSRPEFHIKYTFSQLEYSLTCVREELVIDDEARADVELFLRESFQKIHIRYQSIIAAPVGTPWPSEAIVDKISQTSSGYFAFASTVVRVVGDRVVGNPDRQLASLVNMLQGLDDVGVNNPLQALDIFYSRILSRVPEHILPITIKILGICARGEPRHGSKTVSAESFWLFLRTESGVFYHALEKLHSVLRIPPPEDAQSESLSFYHKSFSDYLQNPHRSGRFFFPDGRVTLLLRIGSFHWRNYCGTVLAESG